VKLVRRLSVGGWRHNSVRAALTQFVKMQLICALLGAVVATLALFFVRRRALKKRA